MNAVGAMVGSSLMMFSMTLGPAAQMAQAADKVIAGSLGGQAPLWAIYVAVHKSFFAREGIDLELNFAQSGRKAMSLRVGSSDQSRRVAGGLRLKEG